MVMHFNRRLAATQLEALKSLRDELDDEIRCLEQILELTPYDPSRVPTEGTHSAELRDAIVEALTEERPLHRRAILSYVQTVKGVYVGGNVPLRTLAAHLSNDPRFKSVGNGEWTLTTEPSNQRLPLPSLEDALMLHAFGSLGSNEQLLTALCGKDVSDSKVTDTNDFLTQTDMLKAGHPDAPALVCPTCLVLIEERIDKDLADMGKRIPG